MLIKMLQETKSQALSSFFPTDFFRVTPALADEICKAVRVLPKAKLREIRGAITETYHHTVQAMKIMAVPTLNGANSRNVRIKLNEKDIACAKEFLNYQWFQKPAWQAEVKRMLLSGVKCELDALANKDSQYITKKCLPRKLKEQDWLD